MQQAVQAVRQEMHSENLHQMVDLAAMLAAQHKPAKIAHAAVQVTAHTTPGQPEVRESHVRAMA